MSASTFERVRREDGFLHRRIHTGEVALHVVEACPPTYEDAANVPDDVPLVVLLHGFPEFWWSWRHQLRSLAAAGFWAVAPDMRGYNESDKPEGVSSYTVEKLASDIAGLVRLLGRHDAHVVGHDWGAVVAWTLAAERPDLVRRLVILNVPHPSVMARHIWRPSQMKKSWYIFFFQLPGVPERTIAKDDYAYLRRMFRADGFSEEAIERYVDAMRAPGAVRSALAYYRAAVRQTLTGRAARARTIDKPVLVLWGDRDRYLGKEMAAPPARFVPNARVVHLPDATHWIQSSAPEDVSALVEDFLRDA